MELLAAPLAIIRHDAPIEQRPVLLEIGLAQLFVVQCAAGRALQDDGKREALNAAIGAQVGGFLALDGTAPMDDTKHLVAGLLEYGRRAESLLASRPDTLKSLLTSVLETYMDRVKGLMPNATPQQVAASGAVFIQAADTLFREATKTVEYARAEDLIHQARQQAKEGLLEKPRGCSSRRLASTRRTRRRRRWRSRTRSSRHL